MRFSILVMLILGSLASHLCGVEGVIQSGSYTTIDGAATVKIPTDITKENGIRDRSDGQGISCQAVFLRSNQQITGIFTTKIRKEFPKTDEVLYRNAARYRQSIRTEDGSVMEYLEMVDLPGRKMLMSVVRHIEQGNAIVLKDDWAGTKLAVRGDVLEVRIYLIQNGYLVEFKNMTMPRLALHMSEPSENEIAIQAMADLRGFVMGSNALTADQKEKLGGMDLIRPYVRGIFKDPSLSETTDQPPPTAP